MSFTSPAPNSQKGRLDAGVDYSNIRGNIVAVASGTIVNVYQSLRGFAYTIVERVRGGQEVYYGLETGGTPIGVRPGQRVAQGQAVARGRGSGGIEVGFWNPATGSPVGHYSEGGGATPAAQQFDAQISGHNAQTSLEKLWVEAGGPPGVAQTMAAIALAESGGNVDTPPSKNSDGSTDFGLWRINSSHTQFDQTRLQNDPFYNAQAAVSIYRSQGLKAWTTYTSGAFRKFLSRAGSASINYGGPNGGMVRPGGDSGSGGNPTGLLKQYQTLRDTPRTAPPGTKNPLAWFYASFTDNWDKIAQ